MCFLASRPRGSRQRLLLAIADEPWGPFELLGPLIDPEERSGENGHGCAVLDDEGVRIVYQERGGDGMRWHVRHALVPLDEQLPARRAG